MNFLNILSILNFRIGNTRVRRGIAWKIMNQIKKKTFSFGITKTIIYEKINVVFPCYFFNAYCKLDEIWEFFCWIYVTYLILRKYKHSINFGLFHVLNILLTVVTVFSFFNTVYFLYNLKCSNHIEGYTIFRGDRVESNRGAVASAYISSPFTTQLK